ncbi:MAG: hypothetical protein D6712_21080 [Chloroflexi bacterium]|nr:MAG: hypothetical protein D6712_21080 [Chloroflexota bacterium]
MITVKHQNPMGKAVIAHFPHEGVQAGAAEVFFDVAPTGVSEDDDVYIATFAEGGAVAVIAPLYLETPQASLIHRSLISRIGWVTLAVVPQHAVLRCGRDAKPRDYIIVDDGRAEHVGVDHPDYISAASLYWREVFANLAAGATMPTFNTLAELQAAVPALARRAQTVTISGKIPQLASAVVWAIGATGRFPRIDGINVDAVYTLARTWGCPVSTAAREINAPTSGVLGEVWDMLEHYRLTGNYPPKYGEEYRLALSAAIEEE